MTRKEAVRINHQESVPLNSGLGFTRAEAESLRRISMTLNRWFEHECNGVIERDGDNGDGLPYWSNPDSGKHMICRVPDRERGARKRLDAIVKARNERILIKPSGGTITEGQRSGNLVSYIQCDPRGAALYILRPGDVPEGGKDASGYYSRGILHLLRPNHEH